MKEFTIGLGIIAFLAAFVTAIVFPIVHYQNPFTTQERLQAADLACRQHGGVERFDKYPGVDDDFVICRDGRAFAVLQRTVDP